MRFTQSKHVLRWRIFDRTYTKARSNNSSSKYLAIKAKAKLEFTAGRNFTSDDHASKPARCYFSLLAKAARAPL